MSTGFDSDAFDFDDIDPDQPGSAGGVMLPEGGYLFVVTEVTVKNERGNTQIECEVLNAKDEKLVGRKHTEWLSWPDAQHGEKYNQIKKEQLLAWCYATKTTSAEVIAQRKQARQGFDPAWLEAMVGRQCLVFVKAETYVGNDGNDRTSAKIEGRVWALDNPKGRGIPGWIGGTTAAKTPPAQNAPAAKPPAANQFEGVV